jgi:hypothetical protein
MTESAKDILLYFAPDIRAWIERRAHMERIKPETLVREIVRDAAESGRYVEERMG